jgi:hypothetical protein
MRREPYPASSNAAAGAGAGGWSLPVDYDANYLYEESYGDAYTGGPIKYLYPSGYQSMRPRSCPWKISIVVCLLFTWLSVFIVGHCSDQVAEAEELYYYNSQNQNGGGGNGMYYDDKVRNNHDDQEVVLQTRWCGSRPLYLLWVTSMLITGLAAAYCGVIGYIKVRDFAIGNIRSLPPGSYNVGLGGAGPQSGDKSDYYVRIGDHHVERKSKKSSSSSSRGGDGPWAAGGVDIHADDVASSVATGTTASGSYYYRPSIYQSDGTPQFWGAHIYRPTQAAVAVTNR